MLLYFSKDFKKQVYGIVRYNWKPIAWFFVISIVAFVAYHILGFEGVAIPVAPVSIVGVALAVFLGFRNSSAYDRWWEARKIWGGIVNASRTWAMEVTSFADSEQINDELRDERKRFVYRHLAWINALRMHLRRQMDYEKLDVFLTEDERVKIRTFSNVPAQLVNMQSKKLQYIYRKGYINDFSRIELNSQLREFYALQGKAERIKNTVFPYYYNYFTRLFLQLFLLILPFSLVEKMYWQVIPLSAAISFVFHILDKSGAITEEPFENRATDTPMSTLCVSIEIDLRQILEEEYIPAPHPVQFTRYDAAFQD
jgi:ion channel-forming bestrophin family protein